MEARSDRAYRRPDGPSDLLDVEVAVVAKDDSQPLIRVEIGERPVEGVAIGNELGAVMRGSARN